MAVSVQNVRIITPLMGIKEDDNDKQCQKRVVAYCRVSTEQEAQKTSYDLQVTYYKEMISKNPDWIYSGIYADDGVSGTSTKNRQEFNRMIEACRKGDVDIIVTKSISRFARNTLDCLDYIRQLKMLDPQVGVYFEKEKLYTLDNKSELILTVLASVAQEESRSISENRRWAMAKRYQRGQPGFGLQLLLGYDKTKRGEFIINNEQAVVVRRIFRQFLEGYSMASIAKALTQDGIINSKGKKIWYYSTVRGILTNEKYCGDVIMQKSFVKDYLSHKLVRNAGQRPMYLARDYYPAIISREDWQKVQSKLGLPTYENG